MSPELLALLKRITGRQPGIITGIIHDEWGVRGWYPNSRSFRNLKDTISYERWCIDSARDHEAEIAAGGRSICPKCGERAVQSALVATLGGGLPGSEYSMLYECDNCDYKEL